MKKTTINVLALALFGLTATTAFTACSSDNNTTTTEERHWGTDGGLKSADNLLFNGNQIGNGDNEFVFTGKQTLKKGKYILKGWVYIANGAELTIEPGTVIVGDKETKAAIIAERGGKLIAQGTATQPIVFTSEQPKGQRRPGDWGGVILCGKAPHNAKEAQIEGGPRTKHGGNDPHDNSGVLSYVRVEFAGYPFQPDKEINGVTLGSVGDGTKIDHVQVSYSNDDSFEWFGGTVNCKNLIAFHGWDDDFDTDNGFSGNVQYGLVVRDPKIADGSLSNGFESDNNADGTTATPYTSATFSNITFVGPKQLASDFQNTTDYINGGGLYPNNNSSLGLFQAAMQIRRGSRLNCVNSVAFGYPVGLLLDGEKGDTQDQAKKGNIKLQHVWYANMDAVGCDANKFFKDQLVTGYENKKPVADETQQSFSHTWFLAQTGNKYEDNINNWLLGNLEGGLNAPVWPAAGSPLLNAASFDGVTSTWFDKVGFIGCFDGTNNWTKGWTNFDPENATYPEVGK